MKTIGITLSICAFTLLAFCYLFRDSISQRIIESNCTDLEFYHIKLKICNNDARQLLQDEKDSIALIVTQLEEENNELVSVNSELKTSLVKCASTPKIERVLKRTEASKNKFLEIKPKLEIYKIPRKTTAGLSTDSNRLRAN